MARRLMIVFFIALFAFALLPVQAGSSTGATFKLDCNGFTGSSGSVRLDRDNTRANREAFIVSATDGAGNVILEPIQDSFFVGGSVSWAGITPVKWTATPQYNPLVLRIVSRAGNGFAESLIVMASGVCPGLPVYGALPEGVFYVDGDLLVRGAGLVGLPAGSTSAPVPLNGTPPRPTNPPELLQTLPAVFIVNTDNLSIRTGDGPLYSLVAIVDGGTRLIPLGRNEDYTWWYVQVGDIVGWAKAEFLILRGDATNVPVVPSRGEFSQPRVYIHVDQPLYSDNDNGSLPLCTITAKQEYLVVGRDSDITWYQIQATCDGVPVNGWIPAEFASIRNPSEQFIPVTTG